MKVNRDTRTIGGAFIALIVALSLKWHFVNHGPTEDATPAVTSANFEKEVLKSNVPVLVDFWAEWCGPCRALGPTIDQISEEYAGKAKIIKMNVQSEPALAEKYGVQSIPCLLIFKNGEVVVKLVGLRPKLDITAQLDKAL